MNLIRVTACLMAFALVNAYVPSLAQQDGKEGDARLHEFMAAYPLTSPIKLEQSSGDKKLIFENRDIYIEFGLEQMEALFAFLGGVPKVFGPLDKEIKSAIAAKKKFQFKNDAEHLRFIACLVQYGKGKILDKKNFAMVNSVVMRRIDCKTSNADVEGRSFYSLDNKSLFVAIDRECEE